MNGDIIFLLVLVGLAVFMGWWLFSLDQRDEERVTRASREARTRARMDALRASQRIGAAFWRARRAMHQAARDAQRERNRQRDGR